MVLNVIDFPREFLYNLKCFLFFMVMAGAVFILHRDHEQAPAKPLPSKPKPVKISKKK